MNNKIVIGTKIETDGIDEGIEEIKEKTEQIKDIEIDVDDNQVLKDYQKQLEELINKYKELTTGPGLWESDLQEAEQIKQQIIKIIDKVNEITGDKFILKGFTDADTKLKDVDNSIKKIGKSFENVGKRVAKLGLYMIGIQSLYGMISSSVSRITQNNAELQAQVNLIRNGIDSIVGKLLEAILPIIKTLTSYLAGILQTFFGIDVFSAKTNDNMKNTSKSAKELRKQLMGFDEMNVLNDSGTTGAYGSTIANDTKKAEKSLGEIQEKAKEVAKYTKDAIENPTKYVEVALESMNDKGYDLLDSIFGTTTGPTALMNKYVIPYWDKFQDIMNWKKEFKGDNVIFTRKDGKQIKLTLNQYKKLVELMQSGLVRGNQQGMLESLVKQIDAINIQDVAREGIQGAVKEVDKGTTITKNKIKETIDAIKQGNYETKNGFVEVKLASGETVKYSVNEFKKIKTVMNDIATNSNESANQTRLGWIGTANGIIDKYTDKTASGVQGAISGALSSASSSANNSANQTKKSWLQTALDITAKYTDKTKNGVVGAVGGALSTIPTDSEKNTKTALDKINNLIKSFNPPSKPVKVEVEKNSLQKLRDKIKEALKFTLTFQGTQGIVQGAGSIKASAKGSIINYPRLASGGIINRPGRGVMLANGGVIGGERGREAVIPLTDSTQMELLGQAIARNIIINLNNEVRLDGKQLARYTSKVMSDMQFSSNGGVI